MSVSTLSESSIVITWNAPEAFEQNGPIEGYEVTLIHGNGTQGKYRIGGNTFNIQIEGINIRTKLGFTNVSHTGLPKFAKFNITVAARTSVGLGPASAPISVTTSLPGSKCWTF